MLTATTFLLGRVTRVVTGWKLDLGIFAQLMRSETLDDGIAGYLEGLLDFVKALTGVDTRCEASVSEISELK